MFANDHTFGFFGGTPPSSGGGGSTVTSFNTRTGAVVSQTGDYNTDMVTEGSTNFYFTTARARAAFSNGSNITITAGSIAVNDPLLVNTIQKAAGGTGGQIVLNTTTMFDNTNTASLNWDTRAATDASGVNSILWQARTLNDSSNVVSIDWANRALKIGSTSQLDWATAGIVTINANLQFSTTGNKIIYKAGSNATSGTSVLSSGTVNVATTAYDGGTLDFVIVTNVSPSGTIGALSVTPASSGNFTINSTSGSDASTVFWEIIRVA